MIGSELRNGSLVADIAADAISDASDERQQRFKSGFAMVGRSRSHSLRGASLLFLDPALGAKGAGYLRDVTGSFKPAFIASAIACFVAAVGVMRIRAVATVSTALTAEAEPLSSSVP